jgi:hypothetical protein
MKKLIVINIIVFGIIFGALGLASCENRGPYIRHLSGNMTHVSTEYISEDETIDIYRDTLNSNVCYVYRYGHNTNLSCVEDEMAFTR